MNLDLVLMELSQYMREEKYKRKNKEGKYKEEKIPVLDTKNMSNVDTVYKKFRRIENDNYYRTEQEIFYKQAKFLENFEDNYKIKQDIYSSYRYSIYHDYSELSFKEFRTYFSWRTKVRKGEFPEIDYKYLQIYISELVNKIGCKNKDETIEKLITIWENYRKYYDNLDEIMLRVIKEFYIVSNFETPFSSIMEKFPVKIRNFSKDMREINKGIFKDKIDILNEISSYKINKSKLLETKYGYLLNECIEKLFTRLDKEFEARGMVLKEIIFYKSDTQYWWDPLSSYCLYNWEKNNKIIVFEGTEKYTYKDGSWSRTIYNLNIHYKYTIGYILKMMECIIREYLGYRTLKEPDKIKILDDNAYYDPSGEGEENLFGIYHMGLEKIIKDEVLKFLEENKIPKLGLRKKSKKDEYEYFEPEEKIEIVFNKDKFENIRKQSEEIQKALIVEEEVEKEIEEPIEENKVEFIKENIKNREQEKQKEVADVFYKVSEENSIEDNVFKKFVYGLEPDEKKIVNIILEKNDVENKIAKIAKEENKMLEIIVSNINEKALETIGDTVIESNRTSIYEDYEKEIKNAF